MTHPGRAITARLLTDAGVGPGMRVLDLGCGVGDVSLLVAELVGDAGRVVGVDRDAGALATARARARDAGRAHVAFVQHDLTRAHDLAAVASALGPSLGSPGGSSERPPDRPFDAAVGRRVLMYLPDPAGVVRRAAALVRPGGVMVFQESDSTLVPGRVAPLPLHEQVQRWVWDTVAREGADVHMGFHLPGVLAGAGLAVAHVRAEAVVEGQGAHYPLAFVARAMLPRIVGHGVATAAELDVDTLEARLAAERAAHGGETLVYVSDVAFGAWARVPGAPGPGRGPVPGPDESTALGG